LYDCMRNNALGPLLRPFLQRVYVGRETAAVLALTQQEVAAAAFCTQQV